MANDLENTIRTAAQNLAKALADASQLKVTTYIVEVGEGDRVTLGEDGNVDKQNAKLVAETIIELDGDHDAVIPMRRNAAGALERDEDLLAIHNEYVNSAISYRANIMTALLTFLRSSA